MHPTLEFRIFYKDYCFLRCNAVWFLGENFLLPRTLGQKDSVPKQKAVGDCYLRDKLYGVTFQKTVFFILTAVNVTRLTHSLVYILLLSKKLKLKIYKPIFSYVALF